MTTSDFIHPEDAAALEALKKIPILPKVIKTFMDLGIEQLQTGLNMASKVRLSPTQLPELYHILPPICERLDIKEPDFYLEMNPIPNAYAFGDTQTAITITSSLVEMMSEEELAEQKERVVELLKKLEHSLSSEQIDMVRELLAEISVLVAVQEYNK